MALQRCRAERPCVVGINAMIVEQLPLPQNTDRFFCIPNKSGFDLRLGVRWDSSIPQGRTGRRHAQKTQVRALLSRMLVSIYDKELTQAWCLSKTESGQPYLRGTRTPLISLAHSGEWLVCAVSSGGRIGVDLEILKSRDWVSLKDHFLHPLEVEWVMSVQGRERDIRAHGCWCRKEALLKALGTGVTLPLESIAFSPEGLLVAFPEYLERDEIWRTVTWRFSSSAVMAIAWPASEMAMSKHDILNPVSSTATYPLTEYG